MRPWAARRRGLCAWFLCELGFSVSLVLKRPACQVAHPDEVVSTPLVQPVL